MYRNPLIISDNSKICESLINIINKKDITAEFEYAISPFSNKEDFSVDVFSVDMKQKAQVEQLVQNYDLIISAHCKQLFPDYLIEHIKCINIHPGYNPINRGWYPQVFAILNDTIIGATIHEITSELDNGPIIVREMVKKNYWDTSETLYNRVVDKELELFDNWIKRILDNCYSTFICKEDQNIYLKKDFLNLKEINLNQEAKYLDVINHLRAMTHGGFKNTYFRDPQTGEKIYLKLFLETE